MGWRDECLDQLYSVKDSIDWAIREYKMRGNVPDVVCAQFRKEALLLLADWERAEDNTASCGQGENL